MRPHPLLAKIPKDAPDPIEFSVTDIEKLGFHDAILLAMLSGRGAYIPIPEFKDRCEMNWDEVFPRKNK